MYLPNCYNENCPLLKHHQTIRVIHKVAQIGGYQAPVLLKLGTRSEDETTTVDNGKTGNQTTQFSHLNCWSGQEHFTPSFGFPSPAYVTTFHILLHLYQALSYNKVLQIFSTGIQFQILLTNRHIQIGDATRFRGQTRAQRQSDFMDNSIVAKVYPIQRCNKLPVYVTNISQLQLSCKVKIADLIST